MIVRNRLVALLYRIAAFAVLTVAWYFYWGDFSSFWIAFSCFDVQIGLAMIVMFGFVVLFNLIDMRHGIRGVAAYPYLPLALPLMSFSMAAGIVYFAYSLPAGCAPHDFFGYLFHVLLILAPLLEWILFDEKGTVRFSSGFTLMIIPIYYYVFGYFRTLIWPDTPIYGNHYYAYPCLDFMGKDIVLFTVLYFAILLGAVSLVIFLNNVFSGKYRRL